MPGRINSLGQTLLNYTTPGIPDTYQGSELWDLHLVDPDNRGAVRLRHPVVDACRAPSRPEHRGDYAKGRQRNAEAVGDL